MLSFDDFIALLHAFLAVITTATAVLAMKNRSKIQQINVAINHRMDELIESVRAEALARGKEEARKELNNDK